MLTDLWHWFGANTNELQGIGAIGTFVAILFAAWQVSEAGAQRDVSDAFGLTVQFDKLLSEWPKATSENRTSVLANVLVLFEVAATGLNRSRFSQITRYLVAHHVSDGLCVLCVHPDTPASIRSLMSDNEVFKEIRLFLISRRRLMKSKADAEQVYSAFFQGRSGAAMWEDCVGASFLRLVYATRIRLGIEPRSAF